VGGREGSEASSKEPGMRGPAMEVGLTGDRDGADVPFGALASSQVVRHSVQMAHSSATLAPS
jgi:hypothetical protein